MILFLTLTNTRGLKTGKLIQNTFTFTKTAALAGTDRGRSDSSAGTDRVRLTLPRGGTHGPTAGTRRRRNSGLKLSGALWRS